MRRMLCLVPFLLINTAGSAQAYKIQISDETTLNIDYLLQFHAQTAEKAAPDGESWSSDFFLRRSRLLLFGELSKHISFFFETDQANMGKNGDWSAPFFVQDAFMTLKVRDEIMFDLGMILLPLTRHSMMGAIGLSGLDYHASLIKYPEGSTKVWRDAGVQVRGYLLNKKLQYRAGVFAGSQNVTLQRDPSNNAVARSNPEDLPRLTGHVRYALLGTETDFFGKGIYFAQEPIVSFGVGTDFVPKSVLRRPATFDSANNNALLTAPVIGDHLALAGDVFADYPIDADNEIVFQAAVLSYRDGDDVSSSGLGVLLELGYRWYSIEPVLGFDHFNSSASNADYMAVRGGLNWWIAKHAASIKLDVGLEKRGDLSQADFMKTLTLQTQLFF